MLRRILLLMICCSLCGFAQSKHPFTFEDMMQLKRIGEPSVSPDNKWVALQRSRRQSRRQYEDAASVDCADRRRRGATADAGRTAQGEDRIRFSPDGKRMLFESSRDGGSQIWMQDFDASNRDTDRRTIRRSPRSPPKLPEESGRPTARWILFVSSVYPDCNATMAATSNEMTKGQVEGQGEDLHPTDVPPLDQLLRRQVQPPVHHRRVVRVGCRRPPGGVLPARLAI